MERPDFLVKATALDHRIPSLAYVIEERQHINIMKNALSERGLVPGPWLEELKDGIRRNDSEDRRLSILQQTKSGALQSCNVSLGMLKEELVRISPGKKICYIADARYSRENANAILSIAHNVDILFIEASFLEEDARIAAEKYHLTAHQAGCLAKEAGAKQMVIFTSPRNIKGGSTFYTKKRRAPLKRDTSLFFAIPLAYYINYIKQLPSINREVSLFFAFTTRGRFA